MTVTVHTGDCLDVLRTLPPKSVHTCVTSPPYWGLRDYGNKRQLGLEPTPDEYVANMRSVFRAVWDVLRDDGTCWVNIGDSYTGSAESGGSASAKLVGTQNAVAGVGITKRGDGLKPKDLVGIPWRVALALQADGWYLRQDIIWHKPNPMPESVTDRCTKAHEYIFLLSKKERYYYDADAIAEQASYAMLDQMEQGYDGAGTKDYAAAGVQNPSSVKARIIAGKRKASGTYQQDSGRNDGGTHLSGGFPTTLTRNKRSVWTVTTKPYSGAHFATFPPDLIEPCILAGCPVGGTVLDPFGGAGTTGLVADRLQRNAILVELNPEYAEMARNRVRNDSPLFSEVA